MINEKAIYEKAINEEDVIHAVRSVMERMHQDAACPSTKQGGAPGKMTLALAKALIDKVEQKAAQMGVRAVVAVSDASARPVAITVWMMLTSQALTLR